MRRKPAGILIHGLGGVGKTTLARGFLHWLRQTSGLGAGALWLTFSEMRSAEAVINQLVQPLFGTNAMAAPLEEKVEAVARRLREVPLVLVWDNFESARGVEGTVAGALLSPEDLDLLKRLLDLLRGGRTKVLITSRSDEPWLGPATCFKLRLGGLQGEERWELCKAILDDFNHPATWEDAGLVSLLATLEGHPLMMRAVLPRLAGGMTASAIEYGVRSNLGALAGGDDDLQRKVMATLRFVEQSLPQELTPLLVPLSLHQRFVVADDIEVMAKALEGNGSRAQIEALFSALAIAGLTTAVGNSIYSLHPALTGFLQAIEVSGDERKRWEHVFVDRMGSLADQFAPKELHEQRGVFAVHEANFHRALSLAKSNSESTAVRALTQSLGFYALNTRAFDEAERLYEQLAGYQSQADNANGEAGAYHQMGRVAQERRDYERAEQWHLKSLAIWEKHGNEHGAASTYHQLGRVAEERGEHEASASWYVKAAVGFAVTNAPHDYGLAARCFVEMAEGVAAEVRVGLLQKWREAGLPPIEEVMGGGR